MSTTLPVTPITPAVSQGFNPNITRVARFDIPVAQAITLFSAPITLLPALTGYAYNPFGAVVIRSGLRYDTAPGNLVLQWNFGTPFSGTGNRFAQYSWRGNAGAYFDTANFDDSSTGVAGKAIKLASLVGDMTVNVTNPGSALIILLSYEIVPTYAENVGSY
jgi:hypothetical protein